MGYVPISSLIFVVIVAIWAAYLVQHWLRRREEAAATRSADAFSDAMRVLEKRPTASSTDLDAPGPRPHSASPSRVARHTVDVERAVAADHRRSPLVARRVEQHADEAVPASRHGAAPGARPPRGDSASTPVTEGDTRTAHRVSLAQRRIRTLVLVLALAWVPVSVALSVRGVLMWISVPFAALTVVAVLFWLRTEAQADRLRSAAARGVRRVRRGRARVEVQPSPSADDTQIIQGLASEVRAASAATAGMGSSGAAVEADAAAGRRVVAHAVVAREVVFDVQAADTVGPSVTPAPPQELPEGSWNPVPVPKPTYTLKAKAEPRYTEGGVPADVFDTPEFADEADELDDRARFARRAAAQ